jgi:protein ImuB
MERLLAVWVEALCEEAPGGSTLRDYSTLLDALTILCPFTEPVRLGLLVLPVRGPSRFFGGEEAVLAAVAQTVRDDQSSMCCDLGAEESVGDAE